MNRRGWLVASSIVLIAIGLFVWWMMGAPLMPRRVPTFTRDVAPIVFAKCAGCHRKDGMAPFELLKFAQVKKRAQQIVEVTGSRFMPPWLPDAEPRFTGDRRLTDAELDVIHRWASAGAQEGDPADLPPVPSWPDGWQLGVPDLVASMPEPYLLPAEGQDVYRNFVVPLALDRDRFVRAVEIRPGNAKIVHHAFLMFDSTGEARARDEKEPEPGFSGMNPGSGTANPGGHFLSWQPGVTPSEVIPGTQWMLRQGADAVFQMHMRPSGKPEQLQARVAFYFSDKPPEKLPFRLLLRSTAIDIPPGEANYVIEASYRLPVDIDIFAVLPHAHYRGRSLEGWAELPDGTRRQIIRIKQWDFNWQEHYRLLHPLSLPAGGVVKMRYSYDNSAANPANLQPLRRVEFGDETSDEMGELWLQVATRRPAERARLEADYVKNWAAPDTLALAERTLARNPNDTYTRTNRAAVLATLGRFNEAISELERVLQIDARFARAHSHLGNIYLQMKQPASARSAFESALSLDPKDYKSRNNLGFLLLSEGKAEAAARHFARVLDEQPNEVLARKNLERARAILNKQ